MLLIGYRAFRAWCFAFFSIAMNQESIPSPAPAVNEPTAYSDADIIAQLDAQQAMRSAANRGSSAPFIGLAVVAVLALPLVLMATMRGALSTPPAAPVAVAGAAPAAGPTFINWNYSFEGAQLQARDTNKLMMVEFYTDWCGVCKKMDATVYPDPAVIAETQNVVPVKINAENRTDLAQHYGVRSYPTFIWMDSAGTERYRISGGFDPPGFISTMQYNRRG